MHYPHLSRAHTSAKTAEVAKFIKQTPANKYPPMRSSLYGDASYPKS